METRQKVISRLHQMDEEARRQEVLELAALPPDEGEPGLLQALGDESWRVRKEAVEAISQRSPSSVLLEELVKMLAAEENAGQRNAASELLERLGNLAVPVLSRHITDHDGDVRKFVIDILGNIGSREPISILVEALNDEEPNVRAAAAESLGKIGAGEAVPALLAGLAHDDLCLRFTILEALVRIGVPVPMETISSLLGEPLLKKAVFDFLGTVGEADAVPLLLTGLRDDRRNAREAAAVALAKVHRRLPGMIADAVVDGQLRSLAGSGTVQQMIHSLDGADFSLKEALLRLLALTGDVIVVVPLLKECRDERFRQLCLEAFRKLGQAAAAGLAAAFVDASDDDRQLILALCGELRLQGVEEIIRQGLNAAAPELRAAAAGAVGRIKLAELVGEVARLVDDPVPVVRAAAVSTLSVLATIVAPAVRTVADHLVTAQVSVLRRAAATLSGALRDSERLALLIKDEDGTVRREAVKALAGLRLSSVVGQLAMVIMDEDAEVRMAAAAALGEIGSPEGIQPLLLLLEDADQWVCCTALRSIARLGDHRALPALEKLAVAVTGPVQIAALEALVAIDSSTAVPALTQAFASTDEEVVRTAIRLLGRCDINCLAASASQLALHPQREVRVTCCQVLADGLGPQAHDLLASALENEADQMVRDTIIQLQERIDQAQ